MVDYNGKKEDSISYSLIQNTDGMTINKYGQINWIPTEEDEGKSYQIRVGATDGEMSDEFEFEVNVARTELLETLIVGNEMKVVDKSSSLYGLKIITVDKDLDISCIKLAKLPNKFAPSTHYSTYKISDFFIIKEPFNGKVKFEFPIPELPNNMSGFFGASLYTYFDNNRGERKYWGSSYRSNRVNKVLGNKVLKVFPYGVKGLYFIGIPNFYTEKNISERNILLKMID